MPSIDMSERDWIVGEADCPFLLVASILASNSSSYLFTNWTSLARRLDLDEFNILKLRDELRLDRISFEDLISNLLEIWKARKGNQAKVSTLCQALEDMHCVLSSEELYLGLAKVPMTQTNCLKPNNCQPKGTSANLMEVRSSKLSYDGSLETNLNLEDFIVGNAECPTNFVALKLATGTSAFVLMSKWTTLARLLQIDDHTIVKLRNDFLTNRINFEDLIANVLGAWKRISGAGATVGRLCSALEKMSCNNAKQALVNSLEQRAINELGSVPQIYEREVKPVPIRSGPQKVTKSEYVSRKSSVTSDFPVNTIAKVLCRNSSLLSNYWKRLARSFKMEEYKIQTFRQDLRLDKINLEDLMVSLLVNWRGRIGREANVPELCRILQGLDMGIVSDELQTEPGLVPENLETCTNLRSVWTALVPNGRVEKLSLYIPD